MNVNREALLKSLKVAGIGLTGREILEQSNSFVFHGGEVVSFNDEVLVRAPSPLAIDAVVVAEDFLKLLARFPDEDIEIQKRESEIVIKGKRKSAGISCSNEFLLPYDSVPKPEGWSKITEGLLGRMQQAARTCGRDAAQYQTTCVHLTSTVVEACDNYRFFRSEGDTGIKTDLLVPAICINSLAGLRFTRASVGKGWLYFRTANKEEIAVRCSHEKYSNDVEVLLDMKDAEKVSLPSNLEEMVGRAEVMNEDAHDARVSVAIDDGELKITSRKDTGWYRESRRVKYKGRPLSFDIHPQFLVEVLQRTHDVLVGNGRMKLEVPGITFVVALVADEPEREEVQEEAPEVDGED